jgi:hypothetical protein
MRVSGELHSPAALYARKVPPVPIVQEAGWASERVWTQRLEKKPFSYAGDRTPFVQSVVVDCTELHKLLNEVYLSNLSKYDRRLAYWNCMKNKKSDANDASECEQQSEHASRPVAVTTRRCYWVQLRMTTYTPPPSFILIIGNETKINDQANMIYMLTVTRCE